MEHVRMRIFHEQVNTDLTDMELIELKFIFARRESTRHASRLGWLNFLASTPRQP
jgi:hypothetical protein